MKSLKFIEESALSKNKMHEIQGGVKPNDPACWGYTVVEGCYYKNTCPIFTYKGNLCKNFMWASEIPPTIITYPKKDEASNDSIK